MKRCFAIFSHWFFVISLTLVVEKRSFHLLSCSDASFKKEHFLSCCSVNELMSPHDLISPHQMSIWHLEEVLRECVFTHTYWVKRRIVCIDGVKSLWCGNWGSKTVCVSNRKCVWKCVFGEFMHPSTRACVSICTCKKRKWLCALCVIVFVLSTPQEKVCMCVV